MGTPVLYLGNKNYSSWSLRPWLALTWAGVSFDEEVIPLGPPSKDQGQSQALRAVSPSSRVPALRIDDLTIWDSLAICEWAAEETPEAGLWPTDAKLRAVCRSVVSEMHAGFGALRRDLPMNIRRRTPARSWSADAASDIARVEAIWTALRGEHAAKGAFLFGARTIADAFFAPVCTRFRTYGVELGAVAAAYRDTVLADVAFRVWERDAVAEEWTIEETDNL